MHTIVTSGDPAGIGPDICLSLAREDSGRDIVIAADIDVLRQRAEALRLTVQLDEYDGSKHRNQPGHLSVQHIPATAAVSPGIANPDNTAYVLNQLDFAIDHCLNQHFDAMITAPVNKASINQAGVDFSGHTEYLARRCQRDVVMMFVGNTKLRIALLTTHLPLRQVPDAITQAGFHRTLVVVNEGLKQYCRMDKPRLGICGLNPHAGEQGYLGHEEEKILQPVIAQLRQQGFDLSDALPADTIFTPQQWKQFDLIVTMFHDQGLPVMKARCFGNVVNVTLGLPFLRTSVDHGTAYTAAQQGTASPDSLIYAVQWTAQALHCAQHDETAA